MAIEVGANQDAVILEMRGISKHFPGVQALANVDFQVRAGEIHALVGENGAGKSTLMKILSGAIQGDVGEILIDDQPVSIHSPQDARSLGIGIVYQEFSLVPALTVGENISLGRFPHRAGFVDRGATEREARARLEELGVEIDTSARASTLSVAQQQLVEIAKVLAMRPRLLVLDEPSAVLGGTDLERLFAVLTRLRDRGISIIYISHRLNEVFRLADRVTVMRDGKVVDTLPVSQLDHAGLVRRMVGRDLEGALVDHHGEPGEDLLQIDHVCRDGVLEPVTLRVRRGEIVGLAGLRGAGRTELARCIFGADPRSGGTVTVGGRVVPPGSPGEAIRSGIGFVTEDRKTEGLILNLSVRENVTLAGLQQLARFSFIQRQQNTVACARWRISFRSERQARQLRPVL